MTEILLNNEENCSSSFNSLNSSSSSSSSLSSSFLLPELYVFLYYFLFFFSLLFMFFIAYYIQILLSQWWILRHFRSPFALPLIGNCYNPDVFTLFRYLVKLRKQLGKFFVIYLFTKPFLIVIEPNIVRKILNDYKLFSNPNSSSFLSFKVFGIGLLAPNEHHQSNKSIMLSYFSLNRVSASIPILNESITISFLQLFEKKLLSSSTNTAKTTTNTTTTNSSNLMSVNLDSFFIRIILRSFLTYTTGTDLRGDLIRENEVISILLSFFHLFFLLSLFLFICLDV